MSANSSMGAGATNNNANSMAFWLERFTKSRLNTCELVRVETVQADQQTVTIMPLLSRIDGAGRAVAVQPIYNVPYVRIQGGTVALKIDPVKGDIGIALFCQRDISTLKSTRSPALPASYRYFDKADALYIGGVLGTDPAHIIELLQDGTIKVTGAKLLVDAEAEFARGIKVTGGIESTGGPITSNGINLDLHTHLDAEGRPTSTPQ